MDIKSAEDRSKNMAAIRSKNTRPEIFIRKLLFSRGYRYRLYKKIYTSTPDLYMRKYNCAVFIHGCFWHRHENCRLAYSPKTNVEFWKKKFSSNVERDRKQIQELLDHDIRVLIIWECTIKKMMKDPEYCYIVLTDIESFLQNKAIQKSEI